MKITLPVDVRYFVGRDGTRQLFQTGKVMPAGAVITLIMPMQILFYDHRDQDTIAFRFNGRICYFLIHEIRIAGLIERLRHRPHLSVVQ